MLNFDKCAHFIFKLLIVPRFSGIHTCISLYDKRLFFFFCSMLFDFLIELASLYRTNSSPSCVSYKHATRTAELRTWYNILTFLVFEWTGIVAIIFNLKFLYFLKNIWEIPSLIFFCHNCTSYRLTTWIRLINRQMKETSTYVNTLFIMYDNNNRKSKKK